jgi:hypothetical protein
MNALLTIVFTFGCGGRHEPRRKLATVQELSKLGGIKAGREFEKSLEALTSPRSWSIT